MQVNNNPNKPVGDLTFSCSLQWHPLVNRLTINLQFTGEFWRIGEINQKSKTNVW